MNDRKFRLILFFAIFLSFAIAPWWLSFFLVLLGIVYFSLYLEALFFAFVLDMLYSPVTNFPYFLLCITFPVILFSILIKNQIRK